MQSGDVKLKPCRNCGGIARLYYSTGTDYWEDTFSYYCEKCGAETKEFAFEESEIVQLSVSRAKELGRYHMMMGENPIYIISCTGGAG